MASYVQKYPWKLILGGTAMFLLLVGGCCGGCAFGGPFTVSEGDRTGTITKFSHRGMTRPTWEGDLNLGGLRNDADGKAQANVWAFSVDDPEVVKQIQEAQKTGGTYTLHYKQQFGGGFFRGDTAYFVIKVEPQQPNK